MYEEFNLPMTLKIHVILDHYTEYFEWTKNAIIYTNAEFSQTVHSHFKMSERIHRCKIIQKIRTPVHKENALKSLVFYDLAKNDLIFQKHDEKYEHRQN